MTWHKGTMASQSLMMLARIYLDGKNRLHFGEEKVEIKANYYVSDLLLNLAKDCHDLLGNNFVFRMAEFGYI